MVKKDKYYYKDHGLVCKECGKRITKEVRDLSRNTFQTELCKDCFKKWQKKRERVQNKYGDQLPKLAKLFSDMFSR